MLKRLDHIGIVVNDIDQVREFYANLGLNVSHQQELASKPVTVAFLPVGDVELELLQPTAPGSNIAEFLQEKGAGLHHLCFEVTDLDSALQSLQAAGVEMIDETPRQGISGRIAFLDPVSTGGVLIELMEKDRL